MLQRRKLSVIVELDVGDCLGGSTCLAAQFNWIYLGFHSEIDSERAYQCLSDSHTVCVPVYLCAHVLVSVSAWVAASSLAICLPPTRPTSVFRGPSRVVEGSTRLSRLSGALAWATASDSTPPPPSLSLPPTYKYLHTSIVKKLAPWNTRTNDLLLSHASGKPNAVSRGPRRRYSGQQAKYSL